MVEEFGIDRGARVGARARDAARDRRGHRRPARRRPSARAALQGHHDRVSKLPDHWRLPDSLRDDTGVIFASAFPGWATSSSDVDAFWTERVKRARLAELTEMRAAGRRRPGARGDRVPDRRARARPRRPPVPLRPPLPLPRAVDGPLPDGRADRRARAEHADQRGLRLHDAGGGHRRGLDPRRPLPARGGRGRRRRDVSDADAVGRLGLPGHGRGGHRRRRRAGRAAVRRAPPRHDPRHGRARRSSSRAPRPRASAA